MGLLDGFLDGLFKNGLFSDDPQKAAQMQMAFGLLGGAPGQRKNFGADIAHAGLLGTQAYGNAQQMQMRRADQAQNQLLRSQQIEQGQRGLDQQTQMQDLAARSFAEPGSYPSGMRNDDNGQPIPPNPMQPGGGGMQPFIKGMMGIDPMKAAQLQALMVKELPYGKVDPKDYTPESLKLFAASGNADFTLLKPRTKVELSGGQAYDPYATAPGTSIAGPQSEVVPNGRGGFMFNPAKISPIEKARLGLEGQRVGLDKINTNFNTGFNFQTGQFNPGISPKENQQALGAAASAGAVAQQTAKTNLPDLEAQTQHTIGLVDKLVNHPGFSTTVGAKGPTGVFAANGAPIPGTDAADWISLKDQVVGQQFMQAYQTLKGAGQITEVEGKKATSAISRMNTAQSEESFKDAANDFKNVMRAGLIRARVKAGGANGGWSITPIQ